MTINECLDVASEGALNGVGFYPGADRAHALRYYAGLCGLPESGGTAPGLQRRRICQRFAEEARAAGIQHTEVLEYVEELCGGDLSIPLYGV